MRRLVGTLARCAGMGFTTVLFTLILDACFGSKVLPLLGPEASERSYRIRNFIFHHSLAESIEKVNLEWGKHSNYRICTDANGFKDDCQNRRVENKFFDYAFIGDSFTEAIGMNYEDSFVGKIAHALPEMKIANLGVSSYSPAIYLAKIRYLMSKGFRFKHVVVFIDISDIQDEGVYYEYCHGIVLNREVQNCRADTVDSYLSAEIKQTLFNLFPVIINFMRNMHGLEKIILPAKPKHIDLRAYDKGRSAWTYDEDNPYFGKGGVSSAIRTAQANMDGLYKVLKEQNIGLSIGVYPWPNQLKFDKVDSIQAKIWGDFCLNRCEHFINTFPYFFQMKDRLGLERTLEEFYIKGDVHFNSVGNQKLAEQTLYQLSSAGTDLSL